MGFRGGDNKGKSHQVRYDGRHVAQPRQSQPLAAPRWSKKSRTVWRPAVPSWEREFCLTATNGLFPTWEKFVQAKKYTHLDHKIMQWDDMAVQESFARSKTLCYAKKFNIINVSETFTPSDDPDLYIDKIDWDNDSKIDDFELLTIDDREEGEEEEMEEQAKKIAIEEIVPTGWDVEPYDPNNLTGLIVGGDDSYWC